MSHAGRTRLIPAEKLDILIFKDQLLLTISFNCPAQSKAPDKKLLAIKMKTTDNSRGRVWTELPRG